ncbi:DUF2254 family protein [Ectothiorhodospira marina]|uniref:DUF2254 family protein n=1 Tax=Ectothiorhodospira marina TaxID=1396821 RepID=UPI000B7D63BB|nr:DUF2254 family protein [Ectothiorhodospira marina]
MILLDHSEPLTVVVRSKEYEDGDAEAICRAFVIGSQPTEEQDLEYFVRRLVEVALRALSPGINDPFTAMTCIDGPRRHPAARSSMLRMPPGASWLP